MSFADDYRRLEEFLASDPDYARLDAECERLEKIICEQGDKAHKATCDFQTWSLCQDTLEHAANSVPEFSPDNPLLSALFNDELAADQLHEGAKVFQRRMRDSLAKAGEASKIWADATDQLVEAKKDRQKRRSPLVDTWREMEANREAAEQEAK